MQSIKVAIAFSFTCFTMLLNSVILAQGEPYPITQETKLLVIEKAAALFETEHVIPEIGKEYATALRENMVSGTFDEVVTGREFMIVMDRILWPIDTDGHVSINFRSTDIPADYSGNFENVSPEQIAEADALAKRRNFGFENIERLRGNIGYIDYRAFTEANGSKEALASVMSFVQHTEALIIDLRQNGGGSPNMHAEFVSYFLNSTNVLIGSFIDREGKVTDEYRTSGELLGPRYGESKPVFILNSKNTYSAAEAFGYTLQTRNRATIVGEATQGGARPTHSHRLHSRFMLRVPVARSLDPITNSSWEDVGIIPDYEIPSEDSLPFAYRAALEELISMADEGPAKREKELVLGELVDSSAN